MAQTVHTGTVLPWIFGFFHQIFFVRHRYVSGVLTILDNSHMYYWNVKPMSPNQPLNLPSACSHNRLLFVVEMDSDVVISNTLDWRQCAKSKEFRRFRHPRTYWKSLFFHTLLFLDLIGDVAFLCYEIQLGSFVAKNDTAISQYSFYLNNTWGQYAQCNQNVCFGGDERTVGREASLGFSADGGECSSNIDLGSWFSLRNTSECAANVTIPTTKLKNLFCLLVC